MIALAFLNKGVIGLTGGMGSGKSTVAEYLCTMHDAKHIDADCVCRQLLEPNERGWLAIKDVFGSEFFTADQTIDRQLLRRSIFKNEEVRKQINQLLHPLARDEIARLVTTEFDSQAIHKVVVEVPLLYEAHWENDFDAIIVVYADRENCLERLMQRDQIPLEEAEAALATQWPLSEKVMRADHVINNNGRWMDTCLQILHLGKLLWDRKQI